MARKVGQIIARGPGMCLVRNRSGGGHNGRVSRAAVLSLNQLLDQGAFDRGRGTSQGEDGL